MYSGQAILMVNQIGPDRPVAPPSIRAQHVHISAIASQATGSSRMRPMECMVLPPLAFH